MSVAELTITLVLKTRNEQNAAIIIERLNKLVDAGDPHFEAYRNDGIKVRLFKVWEAKTWSDAYMESLKVAQSFAKAWTVYGEVSDALALYADEFKISGIDWAEISMERRDLL